MTAQQGQAYTPGKRVADRFTIRIENGEWLDTDQGDNRLSAAADNAVLALAEHLGCNAVDLAERLDLVSMLEALSDYRELLRKVIEDQMSAAEFMALEDKHAAVLRLTAEKE